MSSHLSLHLLAQVVVVVVVVVVAVEVLKVEVVVVTVVVVDVVVDVVVVPVVVVPVEAVPVVVIGIVVVIVIVVVVPVVVVPVVVVPVVVGQSVVVVVVVVAAVSGTLSAQQRTPTSSDLATQKGSSLTLELPPTVQYLPSPQVSRLHTNFRSRKHPFSLPRLPSSSLRVHRRAPTAAHSCCALSCVTSPPHSPLCTLLAAHLSSFMSSAAKWLAVQPK